MDSTEHLTEAQVEAIKRLHARYHNDSPVYRDFYHPFDLPKGYVSGWIIAGYAGVPYTNGDPRAKALYVGVSPDGEVSS